MLHIGLGSFHRAHQAVYMQRVHALDNKELMVSAWPLTGGNIRSDMVENEAILHRQQCRYTLETINSAGVHEYSVIRSISNVVPWDQHLQGLVSVGKNPVTKIISFTVTEGGYYLNSTMDALDTSNQDIKNDLAQLQSLVTNYKARQQQQQQEYTSSIKPVSIYGAIALILLHRPIDCPITLMSCDNVRHNGEHLITASKNNNRYLIHAMFY